MKYAIAAFLALYPWAPILFCRIFPKLDIWQQQQQFVQIGIITLFALSFVFKPDRVKVKNIPFAVFIGYMGLRTFESWWEITISKGIPFPCFYLLNFIYLLIFYKLCVQYLNKQSINLALRWISYSVLGCMFLCVLEVFGLSQFIKLNPGIWTPPDKAMVTGIIGNPTLLAAYLGMCSPLFFKKDTFSILSLCLLWIILLFFTGQGKVVSTTGLLTGLAVSGYYLYNIGRKRFYIFCGCILAAFFLFFGKINSELFSFTGRLEVWKKYFDISKDTFLLGRGLGSVQLLSVTLGKIGSYRFSHLHNDFLEAGFKLGLLGLVSAIYCIVDYFKVKIKFDCNVLILRGIFLGFLVSCLSVFPSFMWSFTPLVMFSYAGIYTIKNKELK